jgi:hypothetical protein
VTEVLDLTDPDKALSPVMQSYTACSVQVTQTIDPRIFDGEGKAVLSDYLGFHRPFRQPPAIQRGPEMTDEKIKLRTETGQTIEVVVLNKRAEYIGGHRSAAYRRASHPHAQRLAYVGAWAARWSTTQPRAGGPISLPRLAPEETPRR